MISSKNCLLVLYTFNKRHRYLPSIDKNVSKNLKFMRKVLVTNESVKFSSDVYFNGENEFAKNLLIELKNIRSNLAPTNILLLLEDLFPLRVIQEDEIYAQVEMMNATGIKFVSFRTYEFGDIKYDTQISNRNYYTFNEEFKYYCQLQPAIWNLEYLISILEKLVSENITDPWSFEFHRTEEIHFMSEYKWPNVLGGFFEFGYVNRKSIIPILKSDISFGLLLWKDYVLSRPRYIEYRIKRKFLKSS
jgi:hypothetical protein